MCIRSIWRVSSVKQVNANRAVACVYAGRPGSERRRQRAGDGGVTRHHSAWTPARRSVLQELLAGESLRPRHQGRPGCIQTRRGAEGKTTCWCVTAAVFHVQFCEHRNLWLCLCHLSYGPWRHYVVALFVHLYMRHSPNRPACRQLLVHIFCDYHPSVVRHSCIQGDLMASFTGEPGSASAPSIFFLQLSTVGDTWHYNCHGCYQVSLTIATLSHWASTIVNSTMSIMPFICNCWNLSV